MFNRTAIFEGHHPKVYRATTLGYLLALGNLPRGGCGGRQPTRVLFPLKGPKVEMYAVPTDPAIVPKVPTNIASFSPT